MTPDFSDAIEPLTRIAINVKCTNPSCKREFTVELNYEGVTHSCPNCGKRHYVRKSESQIWIKAIGTRAGSDTSDKATY